MTAVLISALCGSAFFFPYCFLISSSIARVFFRPLQVYSYSDTVSLYVSVYVDFNGINNMQFLPTLDQRLDLTKVARWLTGRASD